MATINNTQLIKNLIRKAGIQTSTDRTPTQLAEKIVPVVVAEPEKDVVVVSAERSVTGAGAFLNVHPDKDFYLTNIHLSITKDVANDSVKTYVRGDLVSSNQTNVELLSVVYEPLVAEHFNTVLTFNEPIKIKKGSSIDIVNSFAAGTQVSRGVLSGYYINED